MKASKKQTARLKRRQESYRATVSKLKDSRGYIEPGSNNHKKAYPKGTR